MSAKSVRLNTGEASNSPAADNQMVVTRHGVVVVNASSAAKLLNSNGVLKSARDNMRFYNVDILSGNSTTKKLAIKPR